MADSLSVLMAEMAEAEVVVASRFHNVVCALKARRPVVSLGYAGKNADLLADFGLSGYDQPIDAFDVDRVLAQVELAAGRGRAGHRGSLLHVERRVAEHLVEVWAAVLPPGVRDQRPGSGLRA